MFNNYHKSTLSNGLRVIAVPMDSLPSVTVLIMIGAGSRYETKKINGISHFLEHMAFKGTKKRPTAIAISEVIDGIGGEFNAFTSKDHTGYYIKAHIKHTELLFDVLSDMLLNSLFNQVEIDKERGVIIEEINMYEDTPMRKVGDLYDHLLYGAHPLGWDVSGPAQNIKTIARQDFLSYMDNLYSPDNAVVVVAGGLGQLDKSSGENVEKMTEKWLGAWKKHPTRSFKKASDKQDKPALLVKYKKTEQAHLCLGVRGYPLGTPKRYALALLSSILGGGMSSRLFIEVREKRGLAYYVKSGAEQFHDVGNFVTQAGVDVDRIDDAILVILDQYRGIADGRFPITLAELTRAKEYLKGRFTLDLEDSRSVAGLYASQEILEKEIRTPQVIMDKLDRVTKEEVEAVARELFIQEKLNLAVIGPFKDEKKFRKLLD